jgi:hypothetical protein
MFSGKIVVHPQLVSSDPVVPVNGAGALVVLGDRLWLGALDNDLVRRHSSGLVKLADALAKELLPLSNVARHRDKMWWFRSSQLMATSFVLLMASFIDARTDCNPHFGGAVFPRTYVKNLLLHCLILPIKKRSFSFNFNAASMDVKYALAVTRQLLWCHGFVNPKRTYAPFPPSLAALSFLLAWWQWRRRLPSPR